MKILFVSLGKFEEGLKDLISDQLNIEILIANDIDEAKSYVENVELKVIISGFENIGDVSNNFFEFSSTVRQDIPFYWFTDIPHMEVVGEKFYELNKLNQFFSPEDSSDTLIDALKEIISKDGNDEAIKYSKVGLKRLYKFETINVDLYIKLSEKKLVKIINAREVLDHGKLKQYENKEIKYLYCIAQDYEKLSAFMYSKLKDSLANNVNNAEKVESQAEGAAFIQGMVKNFKVDVQTVNIVNEVTKSCMATASKSPALKLFFDNLTKEKDGYLYNHSTMISYLASMAVDHMELSVESSKQKLVTAALLHDAGLENEKCARIDTLKELEQSNLTPNEHRKVKIHMVTIAERVKTVETILPDVSNIILCHHERPDGSGFPRQLTENQIPLLGAIFIITEEFVKRIFDKNISLELCRETIKEMDEMYNKGSFEVPFKAFCTMIEKNIGSD